MAREMQDNLDPVMQYMQKHVVETKHPSTLAATIVFSIAFASLAVASYVLPDIRTPAIAGFLVLATLPWAIRGIGSGARTDARINVLEERMSCESLRTDALAALSLNRSALEQLMRLNRHDGYGAFQVEPAFLYELVCLQDLGFIRCIAPVRRVDDLRCAPQRDNLSRYIQLTLNGKEFLKQRETTGAVSAPVGPTRNR